MSSQRSAARSGAAHAAEQGARRAGAVRRRSRPRSAGRRARRPRRCRTQEQWPDRHRRLLRRPSRRRPAHGDRGAPRSRSARARSPGGRGDRLEDAGDEARTSAGRARAWISAPTRTPRPGAIATSLGVGWRMRQSADRHHRVGDDRHRPPRGAGASCGSASAGGGPRRVPPRRARPRRRARRARRSDRAGASRRAAGSTRSVADRARPNAMISAVGSTTTRASPASFAAAMRCRRSCVSLTAVPARLSARPSSRTKAWSSRSSLRRRSASRATCCSGAARRPRCT